MNRILAFVMCCFVNSATAAISQTSPPPYDANYIPFQLSPKSFAPCGIRIGVDKRWLVSKSVGVNPNGAKETVFSLAANKAFWRADEATRPYSNVAQNPLLHLTLSCHETELSVSKKFDSLAGFAERLHASVGGIRGYKLGKLQRFEVAGIGPVYAFYGQRKIKTGGILDIAKAFALHRGQLVTIAVNISRSPGPIARKKLKPGTVVSAISSSGARLTARLTSPARLDPRSGMVAYDRTQATNNAMAKALFESLRAN